MYLISAGSVLTTATEDSHQITRSQSAGSRHHYVNYEPVPHFDRGIALINKASSWFARCMIPYHHRLLHLAPHYYGDIIGIIYELDIF